MSASLRNQTVYAPAVSGVRPATILVMACLSLLLVLSSKVWLKASLVDLGYSLAAEKRLGASLQKERNELLIVKDLMLQQNHLTAQAESLKLVPIIADQIINLD